MSRPASKHRLYVIDFDSAVEPDAIELPQAAAHYVARVLRLRPGANLTLFNGDGWNYDVEILAAAGKTVRCALLERRSGPARSGSHLALALLKGERMDYAIQKATELDVDRIYLTVCERCEARIAPARLERRMQHWRGVAASACEQSGRTRLPELLPPQPLVDVLAATADCARIALLPNAESTTFALANPADDVCVFTGPEGGYTDDEYGTLAESAQAISVGELILRAETAPVVALALLAQQRLQSRNAAS